MSGKAIEHDENNGKMGDDMFGDAPLTIRASNMIPARCCYITGLLDAAMYFDAPMDKIVEMMREKGVTAEELTAPCVGKSRGVA